MKIKKFEELTKEERERICNGCGAKGGWIRPPHGEYFKDPCDRHDYDYYLGGSWLSRFKADNIFLIRLLRQSMKSKKIIWKGIYSGWSVLYYIGVRIAGWKFFEY